MTRSGIPPHSFASPPGEAFASLIVVNPPHIRGRAFVVPPQRSVIGRDEGVDFRLADPEVSRHHAAVWLADNAAWLADLDSSNGTRVNGRPVGSAPRRLAAGDLVALGGVELVVQGADGRTGRYSVPGYEVRYEFAGGQSANQIYNVGRDYRIAHHNRYDVDVNPLPRSRTAQMLILLGVTLKLVGMGLAGYWIVAFIAEIFDVIQSPPDSPPKPDLPPFLPWVPAGMALVLLGTTLWIYGAVIAFSTRRRRT